MQNLSNLRKVEEDIASQQDDLKQQMLSPVLQFLAERKIGGLDECTRRPRARDLDTVHRGTQELVISLDDTQAAADEDKLLRPLGLVA